MNSHAELVLVDVCQFRQCRYCAHFNTQPTLGHRHWWNPYLLPRRTHWISYSVDTKYYRVHRYVDRHLRPPFVRPGHDWYYYELPMPTSRHWDCFQFLERQVDKPMRSWLTMHFWSVGLWVRGTTTWGREAEWTDTDAWFCAELVAAVWYLFAGEPTALRDGRGEDELPCPGAMSTFRLWAWAEQCLTHYDTLEELPFPDHSLAGGFPPNSNPCPGSNSKSATS